MNRKAFGTSFLHWVDFTQTASKTVCKQTLSAYCPSCFQQQNNASSVAEYEENSEESWNISTPAIYLKIIWVKAVRASVTVSKRFGHQQSWHSAQWCIGSNKNANPGTQDYSKASSYMASKYPDFAAMRIWKPHSYEVLISKIRKSWEKPPKKRGFCADLDIFNKKKRNLYPSYFQRYNWCVPRVRL